MVCTRRGLHRAFHFAGKSVASNFRLGLRLLLSCRRFDVKEAELVRVRQTV
jgi:hypothetical protein